MTASGFARPPGRVRPFTPSQESAADLSDRTVGRDETLEILVDRLVSAATSGNRAHSLLVGPRGSGKTHLLNVALHRALQRPEVRKRLRFVRFDEDAVGITRYFDILQEVLSALSPPQPGSRRSALPLNPEEAVAEALGDQVLVLVIENLDRIFHAFGEGGQQDFRSWVENSRQVMVLATTPLLFPGVSDRALPWWGNFGISHLEELDVGQGRELLIRLAQGSGDTALAEFLATDKGEARLRAINALAGGSPRIWMILSECLTVELLDELVPAVEALLEGLVPYYQQLLWDLSPVEQRLVRELADGPHQAATVAELAKAAGIEQRVAASTLGRLADIRWVRAEKVPELDKRSTWYRLREPMLRHHFHYRSATTQPLPLIVEILRAWYDPDERRGQLLRAEPGSHVERFAAATLRAESRRFDLAYGDRDPDALQVEARTWVYGAAADSRTPEAGSLIDTAVMSIRAGAAEARDSIERRQLDVTTKRVADVIVKCAAAQDGAVAVADRVAELLRLAAKSTTGMTHDVIEFVSACWDAPSDSRTAIARLRTLAAGRQFVDDRLGLDVRHELAWLTADTGDPASARDQFATLVVDRARVCGPEDRDTLSARQGLAWATDDAVSARDQFAALVVDRARVAGPDDRETLRARHSLAWFTGEAGDPFLARDLFAALAVDFLRVFGPYDRDTLRVRRSLAWFTGDADGPASARELYGQLVADFVRMFGPDDSDTLATRDSLAWFTAQAGDPASARDLFAALVADRTRVFGADDRDTLDARRSLAWFTAEAGDPASARDLLEELVADFVRVFGSDDSDTLDARHTLAWFTAEAGDPASARDQFEALAADYARVLGPENRATLRARIQLAWLSGEVGVPLQAINEARPVLRLGPHNAPELTALANAVIRENVRKLLSSQRSQLVDPLTLEGQLVTDLRVAVEGSAEAMVRLPLELVEIVESLRASLESVGSR
jgi:hypothetical protein